MMDPIDYCLCASPMAPFLLAGTESGVCLLRLGSGEASLHRVLEAELPFAEFRRVHAGPVGSWARSVARYLAGRSDRLDVPLDVRGSRFQRRVWAALRQIPMGETRSYSEIARSLGSPRGARAVARACAANPVPIINPCHRITLQGGGIGGYSGGLPIKRELLRREGAGPTSTRLL